MDGWLDLLQRIATGVLVVPLVLLAFVRLLRFIEILEEKPASPYRSMWWLTGMCVLWMIVAIGYFADGEPRRALFNAGVGIVAGIAAIRQSHRVAKSTGDLASSLFDLDVDSEQPSTGRPHTE